MNLSVQELAAQSGGEAARRRQCGDLGRGFARRSFLAGDHVLRESSLPCRFPRDTRGGRLSAGAFRGTSGAGADPGGESVEGFRAGCAAACAGTDRLPGGDSPERGDWRERLFRRKHLVRRDVVLEPGVQVGDHVRIGAGCYIGHEATIGEGYHDLPERDHPRALQNRRARASFTAAS